MGRKRQTAEAIARFFRRQSTDAPSAPKEQRDRANTESATSSQGYHPSPVQSGYSNVAYLSELGDEGSYDGAPQMPSRDVSRRATGGAGHAVINERGPVYEPIYQTFVANTGFLSNISHNDMHSQAPVANTTFLSEIPSAPRGKARAHGQEQERLRASSQLFPDSSTSPLEARTDATESSSMGYAEHRNVSTYIRQDSVSSTLAWKPPVANTQIDPLTVFPPSSDISTIPFTTDSRTWKTSTVSGSEETISNHVGAPGNTLTGGPMFVYPRLRLSGRSIRLLVLGPKMDDSGSDMLRCSLRTVEPGLTHKPYKCLSYCWGMSSATTSILLSAYNKQYKLKTVTQNLYNALRKLQSPYEARTLWIDALCINQEDAEERSAQVSMMKDIYKNAAGVIIWLGESTVSLSASIATITALSNHFQAITMLDPRSVIGDTGLQLTSREMDQLTTFASNSPEYAYKLVAHFFSLPYFRRVWVLQEAFSQASIDVHLGDHVLPWASVILAALWQSCFTRSMTSTTSSGFRGLDARGYLPELWLGLLHTRQLRGLPLLELAARARDFEATDARDKVFALLGLANDLEDVSARRAGLCPNYTKSRAEVYTAFAKDLIATTGKLDVLSLVDTFSAEKEDKTDEPSWMPNLDVPTATIRGLGFPRKYNASSSTTINTRILTQPPDEIDALRLSGIIIDRITHPTACDLRFSRSLTLFMNADEAITTLWRNPVRQIFSQQPSVSESAALHRYLHLLTATGFATPTKFPDHPLGEVIPTRDAPFIIADFAAHWARIEPDFSSFGEPVRSHLAQHAGAGDADQFCVLAGKACHERRFFVSDAGRMGLCPSHVRSGDMLAVLYGGSVPCLLREVGGGRWRFVGECYVDGVMFGEAMGGRLPEQVFCIV